MGNAFFDRFAELCKSSGETPNYVAKKIGVSSGSVTAWKNGTEPRSSTAAKIADYFGVSTDYLLGNDQKEKAPAEVSKRKDILDDVDVAFYGDYRELTEDDKETVRDMVRVMRERRSKQRE